MPGRLQVAIVSVGKNQGTFLHPRADVVDKVLIQTDKVQCVKAPPVRVLLQTSEGEKMPCSATGCMTFKGASVGNITVTTDGKSAYEIAVEREPDVSNPYFSLPKKYPWQFEIR